MTKHERCEIDEQELLLYHYRELDEQEQGRITSHLEACARCRRKIDEFAATLSAAAPDEMEWSGADQRRFCARIDERINRRRQPAGLWIGGVAAAMLMVALLLPWRSDIPEQLSTSPQPLKMMAELEIFEHLDFLQAIDLLEILDLLDDLEPIG
jgi:anti-sigma factor RsiW